MNIIEFKNVWEVFRIKFIVDSKPSWENLWALKDINFQLKKGETLGIIGENGAGKTTLLKLIAGILQPDRGEILVKGKVAGLLELGAGFQTELTGRDNVYLSGSMFGLNKKEIDGLYEDIVNFASLGKFINAQVKCYSQGMFVRLAFSVAVHMNPDILLIDDTLAVGDEYFQRKCIRKIFEIKEQGTTLVFVTHDMNMLRRLCKRVIFLKEGRIINDGLAEKVIPLYTQIVGAKKEVGVLSRSPLTVVFNSGKLFINWQDKLITPTSGLYTSFHILGKWYGSPQADWEIEKRDDNSLIARGKLYQLELIQIWKIELISNYEIKLDIEIESQSSLDIQEGYINVMVTNEYTRWCTALEKGEFPPIAEKDKDWFPLLENGIGRSAIAVEKSASFGNITPSLIFQCLTPSSCYSQVLNGDYFSNCRILQYKTAGSQNYSKIHGSCLPYFSGKIVVGDFLAKDYLEKLQDDYTLNNGRLRLIFNDGKCVILWDGKALTKNNHIGTMLYANGRWYSSKMADWHVKKENSNLLIAKGIWRDLPLTQIWEIRKNGDLSFLWKIYLEISETVDIPEQYVQFECSQEYGYYYTNYGRGKFPEEFLDHQKDMLQRCILEGKIIFQNEVNSIPPLSVEFSKGLGNFAKIFNSDISNQARILSIDKVEAEDNVRFFPGKYLCFNMTVSLNKDKPVWIEDSVKTLQKGKLKLIFDDGRGCIYWNNHELTKKLSLYTSLRVLGTWHDSYSSAVWYIKEKGDAIECEGRWLYLPLRQRWLIRLKEDNIIELDFKAIIEKKIEVERLQTNVMLTERYKEWFNDKNKGFFPPFKADIDDDWEVISSNVNEKFVGVLNNNTGRSILPIVKLLPQEIESGYTLNIVNSDLYHRGRVLQYLKKGNIILSKGEYSYFKGKISIKER